MSKVTALYHVVFCTKCRKPTLPDDLREDIYRFIWAEVKKHNCRLIRIGGISNHVHMLLDLHPDEKLSALIRNIKANSSGWMHRDARFVRFDGWAREYFAVSVSPIAQNSVISYINSQPEHHKVHDFHKELKELYALAGLSYNDKDMM